MTLIVTHLCNIQYDHRLIRQQHVSTNAFISINVFPIERVLGFKDLNCFIDQAYRSHPYIKNSLGKVNQAVVFVICIWG